MNINLAELLAARLRPLPFAERVVGLARPVDTVVEESFDDKATTRRIKTPVAIHYPAATADCDRDERFLLPDKATGAVFFFEDLGTIDFVQVGIHGKESTLRLLGWLNPSRFSAALSESAFMDSIWTALQVGRRTTAGEYHQLNIVATALPAEAALFAKYTYANDATALLYPPYQLIGLELKCRYFYRPDCPAHALPTLIDLTPCIAFP